jgi:hypothetical protein
MQRELGRRSAAISRKPAAPATSTMLAATRVNGIESGGA